MPTKLFLKFVEVVIVGGFLRCLGIAWIWLFRVLALLLLFSLVDVD